LKQVNAFEQIFNVEDLLRNPHMSLP